MTATSAHRIIKMLSEAELRGIDLRELRKESFTSREHLVMVTMHELKAEAYWTAHREIERPPLKKIPAKVKSVKPVAMVGQSKTYRFTPEQINIAEAIYRNEKTK